MHGAMPVINKLRAEETKLACPEAGSLRSGSFPCELATPAAPARRARVKLASERLPGLAAHGPSSSAPRAFHTSCLSGFYERVLPTLR